MPISGNVGEGHHGRPIDCKFECKLGALQAGPRRTIELPCHGDGSEFGLDQGDELADILQLVDLARGKFDGEGLFDRENQPYVAEAVPSIDVLGRRQRRNLELVVIEHLLKYRLEFF
jgi:hypothetical protein